MHTSVEENISESCKKKVLFVRKFKLNRYNYCHSIKNTIFCKLFSTNIIHTSYLLLWLSSYFWQLFDSVLFNSFYSNFHTILYKSSISLSDLLATTKKHIYTRKTTILLNDQTENSNTKRQFQRQRRHTFS